MHMLPWIYQVKNLDGAHTEDECAMQCTLSTFSKVHFNARICIWCRKLNDLKDNSMNFWLPNICIAYEHFSFVCGVLIWVQSFFKPNKPHSNTIPVGMISLILSRQNTSTSITIPVLLMTWGLCINHRLNDLLGSFFSHSSNLALFWSFLKFSIWSLVLYVDFMYSLFGQFFPLCCIYFHQTE